MHAITEFLLRRPVLLGCLLAVPSTAQAPLELLRPRRNQPLLTCPFEAPKLSSRNPAEVAWAATRLTPAMCGTQEVVDELGAALEVMRKGQSEAHERAVLHLLHAALQYDITLPMARLRFEPAGRTRIPWLALQVRGASKGGGELFAWFRHFNEEYSGGWEVLGGALAIRGHGAFAIELRTHMQPTLRVYAGERRVAPDRARQRDANPPEPLPDFPEQPLYSWDRDARGTVAAGFQMGSPKTDWVVDQMCAERAHLRWLALLTGEPDPRAWAARFDAAFHARDIGSFEVFARGAEQRAADALAAADATLRARFKLPEHLHLPELQVVRQDFRSDQQKAAQPMPEPTGLREAGK